MTHRLCLVIDTRTSQCWAWITAQAPGIRTFRGDMLHTARWDYRYTGGSPDRPVLNRLKGKRVGVIGTGATAVQVVPYLAAHADTLHVFQVGL